MYIYIYTDTYIQITMDTMCIYIIAHIYTISWYSMCFTYVGVSCFGSTKLIKRFQGQRPVLF